MSQTPNFDAKIQTILDATLPGERVCPISGERWQITSEDIERLRKWNVPPPTLGPTIRLKLLSVGVAGIDLWYKPHAKTGKQMLCASDPDSLHPVVEDLEWYELSDEETISSEIDESKTAFEQIKEIVKKVPSQARYSTDVSNVVGGGIQHSQNCFMVFGTFYTKDSFYTFRCKELDRCMDCVFTEESSEAFSCAMAVRLHKCSQVFHSIDCINSAFLFDCRNCENCFCSSNLRNKKFVFKNEQLTESEYRERMREIDLQSTNVFEQWKDEFKKMLETVSVWPENFNINSDNSSGEYFLNCQNSSGWYGSTTRDVNQMIYVIGQTENADSIVVSEFAHDVYSSTGIFKSQDIKFTCVAVDSRQLEYCSNCRNCENCFGCHGLCNKKFHIFNKPFSESEYWEQVDKIKCQMLEQNEYGQPMPIDFCVWHPETCLGSLIMPFTEDELVKLNVRRLDPEKALRYAPYSQIIERGRIEEVPDKIEDVTEVWDKVIFDDSKQKRPFMVNKMEREFRQAHGLPFPREHYRGRLLDLIKQVNSPEREEVTCAECEKKIMVNKNRAFPKRRILCLEHYYRFLENNG